MIYDGPWCTRRHRLHRFNSLLRPRYKPTTTSFSGTVNAIRNIMLYIVSPKCNTPFLSHSHYLSLYIYIYLSFSFYLSLLFFLRPISIRSTRIHIYTFYDVPTRLFTIFFPSVIITILYYNVPVNRICMFYTIIV